MWEKITIHTRSICSGSDLREGADPSRQMELGSCTPELVGPSERADPAMLA